MTKRLIISALAALTMAACEASPAFAGGQTGVGGTLDVSSADSQAFTGAVAMTVGASYAPGRSILIDATAAGNVSLTFFDGSTLVVPVNAGITILPFAVTAVNTSGTTATATYANLTWVPGG